MRSPTLLSFVNDPYRPPDDASQIIYDCDTDYIYLIHTLTDQEAHIRFADIERGGSIAMIDSS